MPVPAVIEWRGTDAFEQLCAFRRALLLQGQAVWEERVDSAGLGWLRGVDLFFLKDWSVKRIFVCFVLPCMADLCSFITETLFFKNGKACAKMLEHSVMFEVCRDSEFFLVVW